MQESKQKKSPKTLSRHINILFPASWARNASKTLAIVRQLCQKGHDSSPERHGGEAEGDHQKVKLNQFLVRHILLLVVFHVVVVLSIKLVHDSDFHNLPI